MLASLLALALTGAPFPLPMIDGKPPAVTERQKSFRLPMRFEKVRAFYEEQFKGAADVTIKLSGTPGSRVLSLATKRTSDEWIAAKVKEGELETVVDLKTAIRMGVQTVEGKTPPVNFILTRSAEVQKSLESIDHTESMRAR